MRYTEILLGGKPKRLRYDVNALADIEAKAGVGIGELLSEKRMGFYPVVLLLWAGLKHEDRGLTPEKAGELLQRVMEQGMDLSVPMGAITKALQESGLIHLPADENADGAEGNAPTEAAN